MMNVGKVNAEGTIVRRLLDFLDASPSPFHAVESGLRVLEAAGYERLSEAKQWQVRPNGRYYFTRNGSSVVAFAIGGHFDARQSAANIVAAHTDSPCLRVRPISQRRNKDGFLQVAVETYGGGLWHTWFDRDLGVAGRIVTSDGHGTLLERLVNVHRPILRIPTLAIHLDRGVNSDGFKFNTELQLNPILATEIAESRATEWVDASEKSKPDSSKFPAHGSLLEALKSSLKSESGEVVALDLCLYDVQGASVGGVHDEFIHSARLDNLFMSFCGLSALVEATHSERLEKSRNISMLVLFDNEEVGSLSSAGAESTLVSLALSRILGSFSAQDAFAELLARSFLLSADMAHAVHPNYSDKHDECHRPALHKGIVLKYNSNQRYTTNSRSAAYIKSLAAKQHIPLQEFMVRNDSPCGSTIGPIVAAQLGLEAVDVGAPQLSMHSIRETAGVDDISHSINLFRAFYETDRHTHFRIKTLDCCE